MLRRCVVLLIVLGMLESALACSIPEPEPRKIEEKTFKGVNGDCYYKLIPQPEQTKDWSREESWRTEFYTSEHSSKPIFTKDFYLDADIACIEDVNGQKHVSHVNTNFYYDKILNSTNKPLPWLGFVVDDQVIKTYEATDIVQADSTLQVDFPCDGLTVLYVKYGEFTFDKTLKRYIYQLELLNNELVRFDLLTGSQIPTEKPLEVLLADAIRNKDLETVENLLARGADPNKGSVIDGTPLYLAAESRNIEMVRKLLMVGAEAYTQNKSHHNFYEEFIKNTPVYAAAKNGDLDIIEL